MDKLLSTSTKRFVVFASIFVALLLVFYYELFKVSSILANLEQSKDLLILTNPQTQEWYWPIKLVAHLLDHRLTLQTVVQVTLRVLPLGFWLSIILIGYLTTFPIKKGNLLYVHQQRLLILVALSGIGSILHMAFFIYGFFGGSVATAITRVNRAGYLGIGVSVGLSLLSLIIIILLWMDVSENSKT